MSYQRWLRRREQGITRPLSDGAYIYKRIYTAIEPYSSWNECSFDEEDEEEDESDIGAVFNLEFSPDGKVLVAACEKQAIVLYDAVSSREIYKIMDAHADNVNCIKFLSNRTFATCSDDTTVALWDVRNLKSKKRSLHGHLNWVKNIEYSTKDNLLVTSGFDGSIFTWDINSQTEQGLIYQKVFHTSGLMRCRITPDGNKLVICTTGGYLIIVHDLDLNTLHKDLCGFRPSIYRLMQMGQQYIPQAAKFDHVFSKRQKRNRVELVSDFPQGNDAEVILALQIHPQGHSFLSRNISYDEQTQWSCVHDINEEQTDTAEIVPDVTVKRKRKLESGEDGANCNEESSSESAESMAVNNSSRQRIQRPRRSASAAQFLDDASGAVASGSQAANPSTGSGRDTFVPDIWAAEVTVEDRASRQNRGRNASSVAGYNFVYAISSGVLQAPQSHLVAPQLLGQNLRGLAANGRSARSLERHAMAATVAENGQTGPKPRRIYHNPPKLMYYIKESIEGGGFIKEPSYSADGRIISSPYDNGVRLLAFSDQCSEYPSYTALDGARRQSTPFSVVKQYSEHNDVVLAAKFSPREPLLVTGCRSGKVVWYHPNL